MGMIGSQKTKILLALFMAFAAASCRKRPRNCLLITVDTCRADHLGCYGRRGIQTPFIDSLAAEGVLFEQCSASVPITFPSHASLLTGVHPNALGVKDNGMG